MRAGDDERLIMNGLHMRNIQYLDNEMFCRSRNLLPTIMNNILTQMNNNRYNLRQISEFSRPLINSVYHGRECVSFLGPNVAKCCQMFGKIWTTQILLRIKLRNINLKIVLVDSEKFTLTYMVLFEKEKSWGYSVHY